MTVESLAERLTGLPPGSIGLIHGPVGYGKMTQISRFAGRARANGQPVFYLDREFQDLQGSNGRRHVFTLPLPCCYLSCDSASVAVTVRNTCATHHES
jgi:hypothetical protein